MKHNSDSNRAPNPNLKVQLNRTKLEKAVERYNKHLATRPHVKLLDLIEFWKVQRELYKEVSLYSVMLCLYENEFEFSNTNLELKTVLTDISNISTMMDVVALEGNEEAYEELAEELEELIVKNVLLKFKLGAISRSTLEMTPKRANRRNKLKLRLW